ncbi:PREDICTED: uncharacterized protein LOC105622028 [Atta cephalotes]|uniref:Myb/SANT-like DNA-binding domain-containing protein n=1 Tax=Atta cephalotes TaxID=12957 RepID=A0A158NMU4_ATTCE|nr:PREDICTED: uncharacterized protein LOC105622028 [Atta cephalotes]
MEDTADKSSDPIQEETAFKWPQEATVLLIEEYRSRQNDFISGKMSQKKIWLLIAAKMLKHGYKVSGAQCLSKFSGLKRTYKAVKDYNKRYGSGSRTWTFFPLMDDLLGLKPSMSSITTVSSTGKRSRMESICSSSSSDKEEYIQPKKSRRATTIEKLIEDFKNTSKIAEEAQERRHRENIELRRRLLNSFDKMLNILEKNNFNYKIKSIYDKIYNFIIIQ